MLKRILLACAMGLTLALPAVSVLARHLQAQTSINPNYCADYGCDDGNGNCIYIVTPTEGYWCDWG